MSGLESQLRETSRAVAADPTITDVRPVLVDLGFAELLESVPALAVRCWFEEQGRAGRVTGALDLVTVSGHRHGRIVPVVFPGFRPGEGVALALADDHDQLLAPDLSTDAGTGPLLDRGSVSVLAADGFAHGLPVSIVRAGHLPDPGAFGGASLARARYALACELLGVAGRLRDLTVEHISTRHQFGAPLSARQVVRHRMADVEVAVGAASAVIASATFGDPVAAAVAKACAGRAAVLAAEWALQHHGAMGFSAEHSVGDTVRHAYLLDGLLGSSAQLIGALGGHLRRTTDPTLFRPGEAE